MDNYLTPDSLLEQNQQWLEKNGKVFPGNILKPHGRTHNCLMFWKFADDDLARRATKQYLASLVRNDTLTSAFQQNKDASTFKSSGKEVLFAGFYLSPSGLRYFGWLEEESGKLRGLHFLPDFLPSQHAEAAYQNQMDGLLCLAYGNQPNDRTELERHVRMFSKKFRKDLGATLVAVEWGGILRNKKGRAVEAFGYADGLSQPQFFRPAKQGTTHQYWNPFSPIHLAAVEEPFQTESGASPCGSYLAFLKLEQNVKIFKELEKNIQEKISNDGMELPARPGEFAVGRNLQGKALAAKNGATFNDFNYEDDPVGIRCPFHAHIRKMNPRNAAAPSPVIVRRGMPYGIQPGIYEDDNTTEKLPESGIGLLFLSFQSDLDSVVRLWQNGQDQTGGADPLVGGADLQLSENQRLALFKHRYPVAQNGQVGLAQAVGFGGMVKLRAAMQFYAPSLSFFTQAAALQNIADTSASTSVNSFNMKYYPLFGKTKDAFAQTLVVYATTKAAMDSQALSYSYSNETHGGSSVPPRHPGYLEKYTAGLSDGDELGFEFFFPVLDGNAYNIQVEMVDWEDTKRVVACNLNDIEDAAKPSKGTWISFTANQATLSDPATEERETFYSFDNPNSNHGYCRLLLVGKDSPLQAVLKNDLAVRDVKRYLFRFRARVESYQQGQEDYFREDNILIVVKKKTLGGAV